MSHIIYPLSWVAIAVLSVSYWFQVWQIHIHREVRDISLTYYVLLAVGFGTLGFTAYYEGSSIFIVKQIVTTAPKLWLPKRVRKRGAFRRPFDSLPFAV